MDEKNRNGSGRGFDWQRFLCGTPGRDYTIQQQPYQEKLSRARQYINGADAILIGAGAGASLAAGLTIGGPVFREHFQEFIAKYGERNMPDLYTAGFYPFPSEEAKWGYWSKHALFSLNENERYPVYEDILRILGGKEYFVLTTNVDHQFHKAGFDDGHVFATQGDYGYIQCARACHQKVYENRELFLRMDVERKDCLVPAGLVPRCPVCGGRMEMNLRCDSYFVEDEHWHRTADSFAAFLERQQGKKLVLLELGAGFNTPAIIRFPFEKMARENENAVLIRINRDEPFVPEGLKERAIGFGGDMRRVIYDLAGETI